MELTPEQKDNIVLASNLRGGIRCQLTKERSCGYLIRPELWFSKINGGTLRALDKIGIDSKGVYSDQDEIDALLEAVEGLEDLSPTPHGLESVKRTNGMIYQPQTHDDVIATISHLEELLGVRC